MVQIWDDNRLDNSGIKRLYRIHRRRLNMYSTLTTRKIYHICTNISQSFFPVSSNKWQGGQLIITQKLNVCRYFPENCRL
jgi:hypothetical protein